MAVLVGERPEEVTDLSRSIKGDVIASNFDEPAEYQNPAAELLSSNGAKRLAEEGKDVVILMDSITRRVKAYNFSRPESHRNEPPEVPDRRFYIHSKHFPWRRPKLWRRRFLTIIATALVDTGSLPEWTIWSTRVQHR